MEHSEDCTGHVVEDPYGRGYACSRLPLCDWTAPYGNHAHDYEDVEHDPR